MKLPCVKVSKGPEGLYIPSLAVPAAGPCGPGHLPCVESQGLCSHRSCAQSKVFLLRVTKTPSTEEPTALALPLVPGFR